MVRVPGNLLIMEANVWDAVRAIVLSLLIFWLDSTNRDVISENSGIVT